MLTRLHCALIKTKDDPYLIGHFSDNELQCPTDILDRSLQLDVNNPDLSHGYNAAKKWLSKRKNEDVSVSNINDDDRRAFINYVFDTYYKVTTEAIHKYDSNHLCLGSRLYGKVLKNQDIFKIAGNYLDVVSLNYYGGWAIRSGQMQMWAQQASKPFLLSEFSTKALDSGIPDVLAYAWTVKTQRDRGLYYQNFTLALLESKNCVGWHWFKLRDSDPEDGMKKFNAGIMDVNYRPYLPMLNEMYKINHNVYNLVEYFDAK